MEREVAEFHAEPLGDVPTLRAPSPPVPEIYKVHTATQGLMRFYAHVQMKTQAEFQEQFDLCNQSHNFQTLERQIVGEGAFAKFNVAACRIVQAACLA